MGVEALEIDTFQTRSLGDETERIKMLHDEMFPVRYLPAFFALVCRSAWSHCLLFVQRGEDVGVCTFSIDGDSGYVMTFGVREKHRRRCVGRRCLAEVEEWLLGRGVRSVSLHVQECNAAGLLFYRSCGFGIQELVGDYYLAAPRAAYLLRKMLFAEK